LKSFGLSLALGARQGLSAPVFSQIMPGVAPYLSLVKTDPSYTGDCLRLRKRDEETTNTAEANFGYDATGRIDRQAIEDWLKGAPSWAITAFDGNGNSKLTFVNSDPRRAPNFHIDVEDKNGLKMPAVELRAKSSDRNSRFDGTFAIEGLDEMTIVASIRHDSGQLILNWTATSSFKAYDSVGNTHIGHNPSGISVDLDNGLVAYEQARSIITFEGGSATGFKAYKNGNLQDTADVSGIATLKQEFRNTFQMGYFIDSTATGGTGFCQCLILDDEVITDQQRSNLDAWLAYYFKDSWSGYNKTADPVFTDPGGPDLPDYNATAIHGVNIAGAEFGAQNTHAVPFFDRFFPISTGDQTLADYYIDDQGCKLLRWPFSGSHLQLYPFANLSHFELNRMKEVADACRSRGAYVIFDFHNYHEHYDYATGGIRFWDTETDYDAIYDRYYRFGKVWADYPNVIIQPMNEPKTVSADEARNYHLIALKALLDAGFNGLVLLSGTNFSGAHSWTTSPGGDDTLNNSLSWNEWIDGTEITIAGTTAIAFEDAGDIAFDMHQYYDSNSSGTSGTCTVGAATRLDAAISWGRDKGVKIIIGETAWGDNATCDDVAKAALKKLVFENKDVIMAYVVWGGGAFSTSYHFRTDPISGADTYNAKLMAGYNALSEGPEPEMWLDPVYEYSVTESGGTVSAITDRTTNGVNAAQGTTSLQPAWVTTDDQNRLDFDQTDDKITITVPTGGWSGTMAIATGEGTACYEVNIASGSFDIGPTDFIDELYGVIAYNETISSSLQTSIEDYFEKRGAGAGGADAFGGVTNLDNYWNGASWIVGVFPEIDASDATSLVSTFAGTGITSLTLDLSSATSIRAMCLNTPNLIDVTLTSTSNILNAQEAFKLSGITSITIDLSSCTNLGGTFDRSDLQTINLTNTGSVTDWNTCFSGVGLTVFPDLDYTSGVNFQATWNTMPITVFTASGGFPLGENFRETWRRTGLTSWSIAFPSTANNFQGCFFEAPLVDFAPGCFDTCVATNYTNTFVGCALTQTSVDNILVSINTAGTSNGTLNMTGGTNAAPSATGEAAIDDLRSRGWTVTVAGGY
jgi:endoglucanase